MVLTVSFALSPVTGLFCHRRQRTNVLSAPGKADKTSANLTPASGRQDHTTSPYAATPLVGALCDRSRIQRTRPAITSRAKRCRVHRIPPRVRDDHDTPLLWGGMTRACRDDLPDGVSEIFLQTGLDTQTARRANHLNKPFDPRLLVDRWSVRWCLRSGGRDREGNPRGVAFRPVLGGKIFVGSRVAAMPMPPKPSTTANASSFIPSLRRQIHQRRHSSMRSTSFTTPRFRTIWVSSSRSTARCRWSRGSRATS
jgi:hypothetical protein